MFVVCKGSCWLGGIKSKSLGQPADAGARLPDGMGSKRPSCACWKALLCLLLMSLAEPRSALPANLVRRLPVALQGASNFKPGVPASVVAWHWAAGTLTLPGRHGWGKMSRVPGFFSSSCKWPGPLNKQKRAGIIMRAFMVKIRIIKDLVAVAVLVDNCTVWCVLPLTDVKKCWICALAVFLCLSAEGTLVVLAWWSLGRCSECFTLEFRGVCLESTETHCFNQKTLQSDRHCPCLDEAPNLYQWLQVFPALGF